MQQPVSGQETVYTTRDTKLRVLRCHEAAVKRIVTEDSPDLFLTVSEVSFWPLICLCVPYDPTIRGHLGRYSSPTRFANEPFVYQSCRMSRTIGQDEH